MKLDLDSFDASKAALVIIDMERHVIEQNQDMKELAANINHFAHHTRNQDIPVHWFVMADKNKPIDINRDFFEARLNYVEPDYDRDHLEHKLSYSIFSYTDLKERLQARGITQILLCGVLIDDCVYHSAFNASKDFETAILWDLTDGPYRYSERLNRKMTGDSGLDKYAAFLRSDDVLAELSGCMYRNMPIISAQNLPDFTK